MKDYESVIILNPVLSAAKAKDSINKIADIITQEKGEIINLEQWGIRKMAYPIQKKSTGFYNLIEFKAAPSLIKTLETELKRDESVMRFLTVTLDKHAITYNTRRRKGEFNKEKEDNKPKEKAAA